MQRGDLLLSDLPQDRVARLSDGQRQCLALVDQHLSSKEIALKLGISPHTVDQRVRQSLHILQVEKRGEAARLVAAAMRDGHDPAYQRLIHQPPYIDDAAPPAHQDGAVSIRFGKLAVQGSSVSSGSKPSRDRRIAGLPCLCRLQQGASPPMK
jgi:DNA-binding CsgD family transcriptional regulator